MVRASPALFHHLGSFAGVRSATYVRLLGFGVASRKLFGRVFWRLSRMDSQPVFVFLVAVDVTAVSRLVPPNSVHHTSLDSHCPGIHSQGLTRQ